MRDVSPISLRALLAVAALGAASAALTPASAADLIARRGGDEVRLSAAACANDGILATIAPERRENFHQASGTFQGQSFSGCWEVTGTSAHILWEDGDQGLVPFEMLHPAVEI